MIHIKKILFKNTYTFIKLTVLYGISKQLQ